MVSPNRQVKQACLLTEQTDQFKVLNWKWLGLNLMKPICVWVGDWDIYTQAQLREKSAFANFKL